MRSFPCPCKHLGFARPAGGLRALLRSPPPHPLPLAAQGLMLLGAAGRERVGAGLTGGSGRRSDCFNRYRRPVRVAGADAVAGRLGRRRCRSAQAAGCGADGQAQREEQRGGKQSHDAHPNSPGKPASRHGRGGCVMGAARQGRRSAGCFLRRLASAKWAAGSGAGRLGRQASNAWPTLERVGRPRTSLMNRPACASACRSMPVSMPRPCSR